MIPRLALVGSLLLLWNPLPLAAEPIRIVSGTYAEDAELTFAPELGLGALILRGDTRGFHLRGFPDPFGGRLEALDCRFMPCLPGDPISVLALFSGIALPGIVSVDDETYLMGGFDPRFGSAMVLFEGSVVAPPFGDNPLVTLKAPFDFTGSFFFPEGDRSLDLAGHGRVLLTLREASFFSPDVERHWEFERVFYEFTPNPIPEPATLLLVGGGLAGAACVRRRRPRR